MHNNVRFAITGDWVACYHFSIHTVMCTSAAATSHDVQHQEVKKLIMMHDTVK